MQINTYNLNLNFCKINLPGKKKPFSHSFLLNVCLLNNCLRLVWHRWTSRIEEKMSQILVGILCYLQITMYNYYFSEIFCFLSKIKRSEDIHQCNMFNSSVHATRNTLHHQQENYIKLSYFQTLCIPQYMNIKTWYQSFYQCLKWVNRY